MVHRRNYNKLCRISESMMPIKVLKILESRSFMVCGIGANGLGGVGRLISALSTKAKNENIPCLLGPGSAVSNKKSRVGFLALVARRLSFLVYTYILSLVLRRKQILFIHPQTTGWRALKNFARNNQVSLYVMDNSFFCIQSYNYRANKSGECLDCLRYQKAPDRICRVFPRGFSTINYALRQRSAINLVADRIRFLCQNDLQRRLIQLHYGKNVNAEVVGMAPDDECISSGKDPKGIGYDMVFHGNALGCKGIDIFIKLAGLMPGYTFLIPSSEEDVLRESGRHGVPSNISCRPMSWSTGLREVVTQSKLICCLSVWSAPIEGALLKSLKVNGGVVIAKTRYGFSREISSLPGVCNIDPDNIEAAAKALSVFVNLADLESIKRDTRQKVDSMIGKNRMREPLVAFRANKLISK